MTVKMVVYENIQEALDVQGGCGGWFWNGENGEAAWFPYTVTQDEALGMVRGSGFLSTWNEMEARINGPIGGPRGRYPV